MRASATSQPKETSVFVHERRGLGIGRTIVAWVEAVILMFGPKCLEGKENQIDSKAMPRLPWSGSFVVLMALEGKLIIGESDDDDLS
jgi:hypothetical protein